MEFFDESEETKELMRKILRKEITLCNNCDSFFEYIPQKELCNDCLKKHQKEGRDKWYRENRERIREREREYRKRPEVRERKRERDRAYAQRPEVKKRKRENARKRRQRPEVKERRREYARRYRQRLKELREEE